MVGDLQEQEGSPYGGSRHLTGLVGEEKARREGSEGEGRKVGRRRLQPPHLHGDISSGPAGSSTHGQLLGDGGLPGQGGRRGAGK